MARRERGREQGAAGRGETGVVRVAVLGCGNVGGALVGLLLGDADGIAARSGVRLELAGVAVGDPRRSRPGVPDALVTGDAKGLVADPGVDVVVELIGGLDPARGLVEAALAAGKPVVTANKELIAAHGTALTDAAAKAVILASLAFRCDVSVGDVAPAEGIAGVDPVDVAFAERLGYVVKLLAVVERAGEPDGSGAGGPEQAQISVRVHPAMLPRTHPLASVRGAFNAVFIEGEASGELMLYGRGAGGRPTASAVLGDLIDAAHHLRAGSPGRVVRRARPLVKPADDLCCAWYLNIDVADRPGVLAAVARVFGDNGVSIRSMEQVGLGDEARLIFLTHVAREGDVNATLAGLRRLDVVDHVGGTLRVLGDEDAT